MALLLENLLTQGSGVSAELTSSRRAENERELNVLREPCTLYSHKTRNVVSTSSLFQPLVPQPALTEEQ